MTTHSVDCVVTSPPYWGLRDYNHEGQIGLEESLEDYVSKICQVFHQIHRVLKPQGTAWLVIGDSYCSQAGTGHQGKHGQRHNRTHTQRDILGNKAQKSGLKPKDVMGLPWRVAFALQSSGWYLRQDIIWHKPNPMPESVTDRCTKAHEYIFLLTRDRSYYFDDGAIEEPASYDGPNSPGSIKSPFGQGFTRRSQKEPTKEQKQAYLGNPPTNLGRCGDNTSGKRNKRSVWSVSTKPYPGAHFATFPDDLIEPCILAGCPRDGVVLDPFMGTGTTGIVADRHGRNFVGIEISPIYVAMAKERFKYNQTEMDLGGANAD